MQSFYLNCWVPSKQTYVEIQELKMAQFSIIAKYIANNDNSGLGYYFEEVIKENLKDKNIFEDLTKLDKWFILTFLRASSVSPSLFFITKTKTDNDVTLEYNLFNILTEISEINLLPIDIFQQDNLKIILSPSRNLYTQNLIKDNIFSIQLKDESIFYFESLPAQDKDYICSNMTNTVKSFLTKHMYDYDNKYSNTLLIKTNDSLKNFTSVALRFFDNTLFDFVRLIYLPFAKNIYKKQYDLMRMLRLSTQDIDKLTPIECEVFLGLLAAEAKEAKESKPSTIYK